MNVESNYCARGMRQTLLELQFESKNFVRSLSIPKISWKTLNLR